MTDVLFRHLEVTNFRSIKGTIHAPLDAKVVLVHGENGAGKTSLLAAGSPCSPARTRLPPLPGCRAPDAGDGSHGEDAPVPPAHRLSARQRACRHPARLLHPSGNRLCGRLELTRQLFGRASGSHQIDHLSPELRRISGSVTGHQTPQKSTSRVSAKPGQLHSMRGATASNIRAPAAPRSLTIETTRLRRFAMSLRSVGCFYRAAMASAHSPIGGYRSR
jgi:AAA domain